MKHLLSLQGKRISRKGKCQRRRITALLLCLCLVCSNLISAVYAAGVDGSAAGQEAGSGTIEGSPAQSGGSSEDKGKDDSVPDTAGEENSSGESDGAAGSPPEGTGETAGGQTQNTDTPDGADSVGAGTVIVGENGLKNESEDQTAKTDAGEYKLYITHVLTADGHMFADEDVEVAGGLTEDDLSGGYDVLQNAYSRVGAAVTTKNLTITKDDFDENKVCYAKIDYHVADGYRAIYRLPEIMAYSIYEGTFEDVKFEVANTVDVKLEYRFHKSTGMTDVPAHSYDQLVLKMDANGNYSLSHQIPVGSGQENSQLNGLMVVLNPEPLEALIPDDSELAADKAPSIDAGEFQTALVRSRTLTQTATANGGKVSVTYNYDADTGLLTASIPKAAVDTQQKELLTLTVYYYRWNPGWYGVNYRALNGVSPTEALADPKYCFGQEGSLTNYDPKAATENKQVIRKDGKL